MPKANERALGLVESKFADIVWENAPITTKELVSICGSRLLWKRTTTYTVLKKLCERGIFVTEDSIVRVLIPKDEFFALQSEDFIERSFGGSLPAFIAAFSSRKKLTERDISEIRALIDRMGDGDE